jgi:predicted DCC family thiol-disulfide oxidoreductase YuxK
LDQPIVVYDGVCGLCNRAVRFVLKHDGQDRFRFASLQSEFAAGILRRRGIQPGILDTFYLVTDHGQPGEQLSERSEAAIAVLRELGGVWRVLALPLRVLPAQVRDWGYNLIARHRYRMFGKYDACPLPEAKDRHKFLDME